MLEVSFGKRWLDPLARCWLQSVSVEDGCLVIALDYRRLLESGKAVSITRARWRLDGAEYQTVMASTGPQQRVMMVRARATRV